jgi:outer membrane immunogenic protein
LRHGPNQASCFFSDRQFTKDQENNDMNNFRKLAAAVALYACAGGVAFAQSSGTDWTGFYLGGNVGHESGSSDVTTSTVFSPTGYFASSSVPAIATAGAGNLSPSGFTGGLTGGYNWQRGSVVFGLEADFDSLNSDDTRSATATYPCCAPTAFTVTERTKTSDLFTARGRLGLASNKSLFYVTAGWARARIKVDDLFTDTFATAHESFSDSRTKNDWIYGLGYEHACKDNWSFKLEYLHADFGTVTGTSNNLTAFTPSVAFPSNTFTHTADLSMNLFRVGVNYRF